MDQPLSQTVLQTLRRLHFELRARVACYGWLRPLYGLYLGWDQIKLYLLGHEDSIREHLVNRHTELVIDGFQGSANSFASDAFKARQTRPVRVAHHLHAPAQIIRAVRMGIPTIVTIRDPAGAVLSLTSRWPHITAAQALRSYARFYRAIHPRAGSFVVSPFERTTRHLDDVIRETNRRFGTRFDPGPAGHDASHDLKKRHAVAGKERQNAVKARKREELERPENARLLEEARQVYEAFLVLAHARHPAPADAP